MSWAAIGSQSLTGRALILASIIVTPLLCFLSRNAYSLLRPESVAALLILASVCVFLAAVARSRPVFYALVCGSCGLVSANSLRLIIPGASVAPWESLALVAVLVAGLLALMRERLFPVMVVFAVSSYGAVQFEELDLLPDSAEVRSPAGLPHVVYVVLDEHIGIGGFPAEIPECQRAAGAVQAVLAENRFTIYPNAYSNYGTTVDSLPSVFNRTLLQYTRQMVKEDEQGGFVYDLRSNDLARHFAARGYRLFFCQNRSMDLAPDVEGERIEYSDVLGHLEKSSGPWTEKLRWIIGGYQASDRVLLRVNAFFPFRLGHRITGPLAIEGIWPDEIAHQIRSAAVPTVFLIHLLTPHGPYLYRRDGSVRPMKEWSGDRADRRWNAETYREKYRRYCEQTEFQSRQLGDFLASLNRAGVFDNVTFVIHGDHGSRIRSSVPGNKPGAEASPERYDYTGDPPLRDLLDRFSVLMAIKTPRQIASRIDLQKASLLRILNAEFNPSHKETNAAMDSAYLFELSSKPIEIQMSKYWR